MEEDWFVIVVVIEEEEMVQLCVVLLECTAGEESRRAEWSVTVCIIS
jgi:hypothetical protein